MLKRTTKDFWFPFYPSDWKNDIELQSCSLAARGAWIELLGLMHGSTEYGYLLVNGKKPTDKMIINLIRTPYKTWMKLKSELIEKGVIRIDSRGIFYSKRMVGDYQLRLRRREFGRLGGNPKLLEEVNSKVKSGVNPKDKHKDKTKVKPYSYNYSQNQSKEKDNIYNTIFSHWNSQKVIAHEELTDERKRAINKALKRKLTVSQITQAITNYGRVMTDPVKYWWDTKWTLESFLNRGLKEDKFLDWDIVAHNFSRDKTLAKPQKSEGQKVVKPKYKDLEWKG